MGIVEHAKKEFEILGWPGDCEMQGWVCDNLLELLTVFAAQGHSGSSAPYVLNLFKELASYNVISPLTGEDSEWNDVSSVSSDTLYQNNRNGAVFKDRFGQSYWIDGKVFRDPDGCCYTNSDSRVPVTFPWSQKESEYVDVDSDGNQLIK